ncbi:MAG: DUF4010 domain-containing protein [Thermofilaceae archaeon]
MLPLVPVSVDIQFVFKVALSFLSGALIGLERERAKSHEAPGVRSVGFLSVLGCLSAALPGSVATEPWLPLLASASLAAMVVSVVGVYTYRKLVISGESGITTPLALAVAYSSGLLIGSGMLVEGVALCFMASLALAAKLSIERVVRGVTYRELLPLFELGVIAFLIGPLLPFELTDPFLNAVSVGSLYIFFVTVLVISYIGYVAVRLGGSRSIDFVSFFGGLANSEATVVSACRLGGEEAAVRSSLLANAAMLARNAALATLLSHLSRRVELNLLAVGLLGYSLSILLAYTLSKLLPSPGELSIEVPPLSFSLAARATALFALSSMISAAATLVLGAPGALLASALSGFASSAAVIFTSMSLLAGNYVSPSTAIVSALIASAAASINKAFYVAPISKRRAVKLIPVNLAVATPLLATAILLQL